MPIISAIDNLAETITDRGALIDCGPLPPVLANGPQLGQLFQNLIGNSIKYCKNERPEVVIRAEPDERFTRFSIKGNGIGIDPQFHDRIFQMFQRLHRKGEYSGTGIGLAICKKVVERIGRRLWVESVTGMGSTFYFTLPTACSLNERNEEDDEPVAARLVGEPR